MNSHHSTHASVVIRTQLGIVTTARTRLLSYVSDQHCCHHITHASAPKCTWTAGPSVVTATTILSPVLLPIALGPAVATAAPLLSRLHAAPLLSRLHARVSSRMYLTIRSLGSTHASTIIRTRLSTATATAARTVCCHVHLASRSCGSTRVLTIRSCGSARVSVVVRTWPSVAATALARLLPLAPGHP
jgi:uncharacterized membrane protein YdcZ (DUF606 family)